MTSLQLLPFSCDPQPVLQPRAELQPPESPKLDPALSDGLFQRGFMFCQKIFLEDNAVASSHGNPSLPESLLVKHLAQTVEEQPGETGFPKPSNLLLLGDGWETSVKPKFGLSAGSESKETVRPQKFKPSFIFSSIPPMRNQANKGKT